MIERGPVVPVNVVGTYYLSQRWKTTQRTVLRLCRLHKLREIRFTAGVEGHEDRGPIFFRMADVKALEKRLYLA
jgi:hypothetical protein